MSTGCCGTSSGLEVDTLDQPREAARLADGRAMPEASGSVTLDAAAAIAKTGVGLIVASRVMRSARVSDVGPRRRMTRRDSSAAPIDASYRLAVGIRAADA